MVGIAREAIDPYHHVWWNMTSEISNERSKTLNVGVTEDSPDVYSCAINMRTCSSDIECRIVMNRPEVGQ